MVLLDRAIRNGVNQAVGRAVSDAVERTVAETVAPKVNRAADSAAASINAAAGQAQQASAQTQQSAATLGHAFGGFGSAIQSMANEAAKNMKICPACGESAGADVKFCPACGAKLPEQALAEGAVCTACGKQNGIGVRFCADCGAKLPAAEAEEAAQRDKDAAVLARWDTELAGFPKWSCGGNNYEFNDVGCGSLYFSACNTTPQMLAQYKEILRQDGFRPAGRYPSEDSLYKKGADGVCLRFCSDNAFENGNDCLNLGFVKPEPTKQLGLRDLFKF